MKEKIIIKTPEQIEGIKRSCNVTKQILDEVQELIKPGVTTESINEWVHNRILEFGGTPATLNYRGYKKSCCISPNEVVCHGVPSSSMVLNKGDIVNVDVTTILDGYFGDSSRMYYVGGMEACSKEAIDVVNAAKESLEVGIKQVKPGARFGDIGGAIKQYIESLKKGYGIVKEYTGHGVGVHFHEAPQVIHTDKKGTGEYMRPGMTFTIEPMINLGTWKTSLSTIDGWTVRTQDGKLSAQWEHTVLVVEGGCEVLT